MISARSIVMRTIAVGACVSIASFAAADEDTAQAPGATPQGPMIVERIHSGLLVAPDVQVTEIDHRTSQLAGGYAGWLTDETFFIGGGGYWLANNSSTRRMAYGGLVLQWLGMSDQRIGWSLKSLIGGGEATLLDTVTQITYVPNPATSASGSRDEFPRLVPGPTRTIQVRVRRDFLVVEPAATIVFRLSRRMRLTGGIGYRSVDTERRDGSRLRGAVGSVGLQIGGGF